MVIMFHGPAITAGVCEWKQPWTVSFPYFHGPSVTRQKEQFQCTAGGCRKEAGVQGCALATVCQNCGQLRNMANDDGVIPDTDI